MSGAAGTTAVLEHGEQRLLVEVTGGVLRARIEPQSANGSWQATSAQPFPLRFSALSSPEAEPVTVRPAWEAGKPETNFAQFHTSEGGDTYDALAAGTRTDLPIASVTLVGEEAIVARSEDGSLEVTIQPGPGSTFEVAWAFTAPDAGYWSVVLQAFEPLADDAVGAILAGPMINERRFPTISGVSVEGYVSAPFALVEQSGDEPVTTALGVHPGLGGWNWRTAAEARYGLGARNEAGDIQPFLAAPVLGNEDSRVEAGDTLRFQAVITARPGGWWDAWRGLAEHTYGLRSYRENIYGSLTDAVHNMADLMKDDVFGGWMERGRGFLNIEHRDGVKLASPGAVVSAALVTADQDLLERRAQPILEYSISRGHYGFTWAIGSETVGQEHVRQAFEDLGGPAWDAPVLVALHQLARGYTPAFSDLAMDQADGIDDFYIRRSEFQVSLGFYHLTGDESWLERAKQQADAYISERIDQLASDTLEGQRFLIHIGSDWYSLLDLWEATGEQRYLDAAEKGARWLAALLWLEPVHDLEAAREMVRSASPELAAERMREFTRHMYKDHTGEGSWVRDTVPYPRGHHDVPQETVPAWLTSPVGMSFEAWCTYRGKMVQNPGWAPYLLRLATATGDDIYRTLAENAIVGRFTNYPGYYMHLASTAQFHPDFPYQGPMDLTSIYYHHVPPQVGIALDFLFAQASDRSGGRIAFPVVRDDSYVQFRHHLQGHETGCFFDIEDAWAWMPRGLVSPDSHLVNWVAAVSTDGTKVGVALSNSAARAVTTTVAFDRALLGLADGSAPALSLLDADGATMSTGTLEAESVEVTMPAHGLVAIRLDGTKVDEPLHAYGPLEADSRSAWITLAEDDPNLGTLCAAVVGTGPGSERAYVYTTLKPNQASQLSVTWNDGDGEHEVTCDQFPFEVSIPIPAGPFDFRVAVTDPAGVRHEAPPARLVAAGSDGNDLKGIAQ
jgi:hypothetical protein